LKNLFAKLIIIAVIASFASFSIATAEGLKEIKIKTSVSNSTSKDKIESITILLKGVEESTLNLDDKILTVKYNPDQMSPEMLVYTINNIGFTAEIQENEKDKTTSKK
jgi:hypothetical protein